MRKSLILVILAALLTVGARASAMAPADPKLDQAIDSISLADNLLQAADFPNQVGNDLRKVQRAVEVARRQRADAIDAIQHVKALADSQ